MNDWVEIIVEAVTGFIGSAGYLGVFLLMAMESACMPIPSEVVLVSAGFLVAQGDFALHWALLSSYAGVLCGSSVAYSVGRFGGRPLLVRYGRYLLLTEERLQASEAWFMRHGPKAVFSSRLIAGMRAIVSIPAGLCHMSYPKFLLYTSLGSGLWIIFGTLFGYFVGEQWEKLSHFGHLMFAAAVLVLALVWIWHHFHSRKKKRPAADAARPQKEGSNTGDQSPTE